MLYFEDHVLVHSKIHAAIKLANNFVAANNKYIGFKCLKTPL
jgi:hypothetical protein